jgi:hypothetical protein
MQTLVQNFIRSANAFDIESTLSLFASDAVIDDVSVGNTFIGADGVRNYLKRFFVGYNTASKLISIGKLNDLTSMVRLDFSGDFGHEVGILKIAINANGLIERIDADLE